MAARVLAEAVAMQTSALGGGELDADIAIAQRDAVVAGLGGLVLMRERRAPAQLRIAGRSGLPPHLADAGHHQHVQQVTDAGAAEVRVGEAHDRAVLVVVARAGVPVRVVGVGAQLHHAEGPRGGRRGVAVIAGADEHVDVAGEALVRGNARGQGLARGAGAAGQRQAGGERHLEQVAA